VGALDSARLVGGAPQLQLKGEVLATGSMLPADTYRVSQLAEEVRDMVRGTWPIFWVVGEVQRPQLARSGHLYFELVEKGKGDEIIGRLQGVVWRGDLERIRRAVGAETAVMADGREIRCRCNLDFYPPSGRLQIAVREIDPVFTEGMLARRRQELVADLARQGLLGRNASLQIASPPISIGLVTAVGSAAYHDFIETLAESGYAFRVRVFPAAVQGARAETEIRRALLALGALPDISCIALVRGGGSRSDLAAFDSRRVAETICACPLPVVTGLGHEIDRSVADLVAHTALKTPTAVAEMLVAEVVGLDRELGGLAVRAERGARRSVEVCASRLGHAQLGLRGAGARVDRLGDRLISLRRRLGSGGRMAIGVAEHRRDGLGRRLAVGAPRRLSEASHALDLAGRRSIDLARSRTREAGARIEALTHLIRELDPVRILERGFSVTRTAAGRLVRRVEDVAIGDTLATRLAEGSIRSRVTERLEGAEPEEG